MKSRAMLLSTIMILFLAGPVLAAEEFNVDNKIQAMKNELGLTDDQVRALRPILTAYKDKLDQATNEKEQRLSDVLSTNQRNKLQETQNSQIHMGF